MQSCLFHWDRWCKNRLSKTRALISVEATRQCWEVGCRGSCAFDDDDNDHNDNGMATLLARSAFWCAAWKYTPGNNEEQFALLVSLQQQWSLQEPLCLHSMLIKSDIKHTIQLCAVQAAAVELIKFLSITFAKSPWNLSCQSPFDKAALYGLWSLLFTSDLLAIGC